MKSNEATSDNYLPTTPEELSKLGWDAPDVILVTGDTYIDSPYIGVAVIGRWLSLHGFKTAIIAQPDTSSDRDITRLGEPRLFWGVSAGCIDSMVANYTASKKYRRQDDYTPGGVNIRPNRASIAYTNLIRRFFKNTRPIILGGVEASLRRIAHYDAFDNGVRRSILLDSKADGLVYGMSEQSIIAVARAMQSGSEWRLLPGTCSVASEAPEKYRSIPSFDDVARDKSLFMKMAREFQWLGQNTRTGFVQKHGQRYVVHNPAPEPMLSEQLDAVYEMDFQHDVHPYYRTGKVRAMDTIRQSITSHRGCFGQCHFCAIAVHQGRRIINRTPESIVREARRLTKQPGFNGIIYDVGGPTANMFGVTCRNDWKCSNKHCLTPRRCENLVLAHDKQISLLRRLSKLKGVKKVFVASGIRHDLVMADRENAERYVDQLVKYHVSGQIKLAPEHSENEVLSLMNKPSVDSLLRFRTVFMRRTRQNRKNYFMTYYLMAAHPGCSPQHMRDLNKFLINQLKATPKQVQIFTPTPATLSTAMYHCGTDLNGRKIYVEKSLEEKIRQKTIIKKDNHPSRQSRKPAQHGQSGQSKHTRRRKSPGR